MKTFLFSFLVLLSRISFAAPVTVYTEQSITNDIFTNASFDIELFSGWIYSGKSRTVCFDVSLTDGPVVVTSVDMGCRVSTSNVVLYSQGHDLPVYVSTATTGITLSTKSVIRHVSTTGGPPINDGGKWDWCVTNIPSTYLNCRFFANGVPTVNTLLTLKSRTITP